MVFILLGMSSREAWWVFNSDSDALTESFLQSTTTKVKLQEDEIIEYISLIGILNKKFHPWHLLPGIIFKVWFRFHFVLFI